MKILFHTHRAKERERGSEREFKKYIEHIAERKGREIHLLIIVCDNRH